MKTQFPLALRRVPAFLIALRFALGPLLFWNARDGQTGGWFVAGLVLALFSDVFDGVIARKLGVATPRLREADSWTDGWFSLWLAACVWMTHRSVVIALAPLLILWFVSDHVALAFDWLKFRRFASYHAYSAKLGGLLLMSAVFVLFALGPNLILLRLALLAATLGHIERFLITMILPHWTPDVPTFWHALQRRRAQSKGGAAQ